MSKELPFIIASFPRSGSHWLRFIFEVVTRSKTIGEFKDNPADISVHERMGLGGLQPTCVCMRLHNLEPQLQHNSIIKLILILRHYNEPLTRMQRVKTDKDIAEWYMRLLKHFDEWQAPKMIVHYELLMLGEPEYIKNIISFGCPNVNPHYVTNFINQYNSYYARCLAYYRKDFKPHGKNANKGTRESWDSAVRHGTECDWQALLKQTDINLFNKYLTQYGNAI